MNGFKYWKEDGDIVWYWSSDFIAKCEIEYIYGRNPFYCLVVTYLENIINK
jgi:hypothetical protein